MGDRDLSDVFQTDAVIDFAAAGLGVRYGTVQLVRVKEQWAAIADRLAVEFSAALGPAAGAVEHIGSTAVPGLLAKPIIDLAIGLRPETSVEEITAPLSGLGWIYRGDAGADGGLVFVFEDSPWHRVAHAHGVELDGLQWVRYLQFRDLLRQNANARQTYEEAKRRLAEQYPDGRRRYTAGKDETVERLLHTVQ